jgi:hypothetical protein
MRKRKARAAWLARADTPSIKPCRSAQAALLVFIRFERFQIGLPPGKFGIIVAATDIDPVGAGQYPKVRMPP